ncbi:MAG: hypothetical protein ACE5FI_02270 [Anaerolineales bacterium]
MTWLDRLLGRGSLSSPARAAPVAARLPTPPPLQRNVLAVVHDPVFPARGNQKLHAVMRWNDPYDLAQRYIDDVHTCSHGYAKFEIVDSVEVAGFPVKADGFVYAPDTYLACWQRGAGFHQPDGVDYYRLLQKFDVLARIARGEIDEVWLFGFPYAGYYESIMGGPGAFWCNAPPLAGTEHAARRFVVMGFNYERGLGEMLEDLGHRAESIMAQVFRDRRGERNLWERFTRHEKTHPGRAECGNVHFAPNSERDYDWGNSRPVLSRCDSWQHFPPGGSAPRKVNCNEWGNGDIRAHHLWWFEHFPHFTGETDGLSHNWWEYVLDPGRVP